MPMLDRVRKLFGNRKPVAIDLSEDEQASQALAATEQPPSRQRSLAQLQQGYDEVMGLVRKVNDHLDAQTQRTEQMLEMVEKLPAALEAIPEINRQNARLIELVSEHLREGKRRDNELNQSLEKLSSSSTQQTEVLGLLQQQFDASTQSSQQMTETLGSFSKCLSDLAATNNRSTDILSKIVQENEQREVRMAEMARRSDRWNWAIISTLIIGVLLLAGIGITLWQTA